MIGNALKPRLGWLTDLTAGGLAKDARFDLEGFENMLRIRDNIAGTWGGDIPPPEKYLELSYHDRAVAEL